MNKCCRNTSAATTTIYQVHIPRVQTSTYPQVQILMHKVRVLTSPVQVHIPQVSVSASIPQVSVSASIPQVWVSASIPQVWVLIPKVEVQVRYKYVYLKYSYKYLHLKFNWDSIQRKYTCKYVYWKWYSSTTWASTTSLVLRPCEFIRTAIYQQTTDKLKPRTAFMKQLPHTLLLCD